MCTESSVLSWCPGKRKQTVVPYLGGLSDIKNNETVMQENKENSNED
jgi:hypothetical protein